MSKKTDLSSYNNNWYKPGSGIKRALWYLFNVSFLLNPLNPSSGLKKMILRIFGAKIGKGAVLKPRINIKYPWHLVIHDHVWIGEGVWIDNLAKVTIQSNVCISQGAFILCGNHNYTATSFDLMVKPVVLEEGVWIGAKAIVCPGVTCHSHAVLSVGSIATKDLESHTIYTGNPAVEVKKRIIES